MTARPNSLPVVFTVEAVPAPQGNHRISAQGRIYEQSSNKLHDWRDRVTWNARLAWRRPALEGAVSVEIGFRLPQLKRKVRELPTVTPDIDKLIRSTLDAITSAGVWKDDSQVVEVFATKRYETDKLGPGATIRIREVLS